VIEISLGSKGKAAGRYVAIVDDEDADLAEMTWRAEKCKTSDVVYAIRQPRAGKKRINIRMHRVIAERIWGGIPDGMRVDHILHGHVNGVDNRRSNLRLARDDQNSANQRRRSDNTSGFKGVTWYKRCELWMAQLHRGGRMHCLGYFSDPADAARAYDKAAREFFGEFALLNFPGET
jgi:hypothetical protein